MVVGERYEAETTSVSDLGVGFTKVRTTAGRSGEARQAGDRAQDALHELDVPLEVSLA